jgi:hypothetical protein
MNYNDPIYKSYITSPRWKLKCQQYWEAKGRWCKACKASNKPLHVHHMTYDHFTMEPLTDLMGLCYDCHKEVHKRHRAGGRQKNLRDITLEYVREKTLDRLRKRR